MFALAKQLGLAYPAGEILFCRSIFGILPLVPLIYGAGGLSVFRTNHPFKHLSRSIFGFLCLYAYFTAVQTLPLTEAGSLFYTAPIIPSILAIPLLKENVTAAQMLAIVVGFLGVLLTLQPHAGLIRQ
jgi:drug/metabolite transporter (DMT)-like permease